MEEKVLIWIPRNEAGEPNLPEDMLDFDDPKDNPEFLLFDLVGLERKSLYDRAIVSVFQRDLSRVRKHLKKIGKSVTMFHKAPLEVRMMVRMCEIMRDVNPRDIYDWLDEIRGFMFTSMAKKKSLIRIIQQTVPRGMKLKNAIKIVKKYNLLWPK